MPRADVARVLRDTKNLMNSGGRHWMKGHMDLKVDESTIERRNLENDNRWLSPKAQIGDNVYCTWGGIAHVCEDFELRVEAMEALVQIIDPVRYEDMIRDMQYDMEERQDYDGFIWPSFEVYLNENLDSYEDQLGDIIAQWNDDEKRTWEEVEASLIKAANKAKKS